MISSPNLVLAVRGQKEGGGGGEETRSGFIKSVLAVINPLSTKYEFYDVLPLNSPKLYFTFLVNRLGEFCFSSQINCCV